MKSEVEVFKIGTILHLTNEGKPMIMAVDGVGEPWDCYVCILKENCSEEYSFMKAARSIVGSARKVSMRKTEEISIKGIQDGDPVIGLSYGIDGNWRTSRVVKIIDECVLITMNSVYAIHDLSKVREKKLRNLGIE